MMKKILSVLLAVFLLVSVIPLAANAAEGDSKTITINENGDYVLDENDYTAVDIDGVTGKITLADAGVFSTGRSAIKVMNNSDVTFVLDGYSTVKGDANAYSCGIEVEYGSKVTFEGEGQLDVFGGLWGAAIGSSRPVAETLQYVKNLRAAGVEAEADVYHTNMHAFDMLRPGSEPAEAARQEFLERFGRAIGLRGTEAQKAAAADASGGNNAPSAGENSGK